MPQGEPREALSLNYDHGQGYRWSDLCKQRLDTDKTA